MNDTLRALEQQYFTLRSNRDDLLSACTADEQRQQVIDIYKEAQTNYFKAINAAFDENEPQIKALTAEVQLAQKQLETALEDLRNIAKTLKVITAAVRLGTYLVALLA